MDKTFADEFWARSAHQAVKYQISGASTPEAHVAEFMAEIEPIVVHPSVNATEYLSSVRGRASLEAATPPTGDQLLDRRQEFFASLRDALSARIHAIDAR